MVIDPRVGFWLSIALAVIGALAGASTQLTTIFGEHAAQMILATAVLLLTAGNALHAVLHAIPSSVPATSKEESKFLLGPKDK
jgi:hypothetical protein